MELKIKNNEGLEAISSEELHAIKKFAQALNKFKTTYFVFNRQLNTVLKMGEKILNKGGNEDGRIDKASV